MHLILFFIFAGFCLAGAINLLLQSHPINSALSLIVVMTSLAVLYLCWARSFWPPRRSSSMPAPSWCCLSLWSCCSTRAAKSAPWAAALAGGGISRGGCCAGGDCDGHSGRAWNWATPRLGAQGITTTEDLSRVLFHELLLPFEVTSVLILIAILGAVALARHGHGDPHGESVPYAKRERTVAK